jgi:hypothetical protein
MPGSAFGAVAGHEAREEDAAARDIATKTRNRDATN